MPKYLPPF